MNKLVKTSVVAAAVALLTVGAALGAAKPWTKRAAPKATTVAVTAGKPTELAFTLSKKAVPKGAVTFKVANKGMITHDFKIGGKKTAQLASGKAATLKVTFKKAGKYPYLCTLPGHADGGMKGVLTVK